MGRFQKPFRGYSRRQAVLTCVALAGVVTAALAGGAFASSFALQVAKNAKVTSQSGTTKAESIVVTARGRAVYLLTGDSKRHPECTKGNSCFQFWPPVTVSSLKKLSKAPGIKGKLGIWHRNGFSQVTLAGHPLYRFAPDTQRDHATGQGIKSFGGTWHVINAPTSTSGSSTSGSSTMPPPTTTTAAPAPCLYPPCQ